MKELRAKMKPVDHDTQRSLVNKCQENGWLMRDGYAWQDDPCLEKYPYEFSEVDDIDELRDVLGRGNWSIRQGFLHKDLAFIQQVDGGDEWWTLKRTDGGWLAFESVNFGEITQDLDRFRRLITSMVISSPESCKKWEYMQSIEATERPDCGLTDRCTAAKVGASNLEVQYRARQRQMDR